MSDLKVKRGDPVSATKWNSIVDRLPTTIAGSPAGSFSTSRVECQVKNGSGNDRDIGEVLAISGFDGPDGTDVYEVSKNIVYTCVDPVWHTSISRLVILAEPIPDEGYGRAVLSGQCIAKLSSGTETHQYVMIDPTSINELKGSQAGIGRLLVKLDAGDYALINFRDGSNLWRYQMNEDSQSPGTTKAKLIQPTGGSFAVEVELSDAMGLMDDQKEGDVGFCHHVGNSFFAIQGPCGE